jgi:hypothetical protein
MKMIVDPNGVGSDEIKREQKIANRFSDDFIKICPKHYGCDLSKRNQK